MSFATIHVARGQQLRQVADVAVAAGAGAAVEREQAGRIARRRRLPGDAVGRQVVVEVGEPQVVRRQQAHRSSTAPTVKPAPTELSSTRMPFVRRPSALASARASGMVAAVVLP